MAKATFGAGCFWGVEEEFRKVPGVRETAVGYSGGSLENPTYEDVCTDRTGHAEVVEVDYDPAKTSYDTLLDVFWNGHNPTQLNRQGPDVGTQYRSAIFFASPEQQRIARAYMEQLQAAKTFSKPIVTQVAALQAFYPAEAYHQDYLARHPESMYIVINDLPKLAQLREQFPDLYTAP